MMNPVEQNQMNYFGEKTKFLEEKTRYLESKISELENLITAISVKSKWKEKNELEENLKFPLAVMCLWYDALNKEDENGKLLRETGTEKLAFERFDYLIQKYYVDVYNENADKDICSVKEINERTLTEWSRVVGGISVGTNVKEDLGMCLDLVEDLFEDYMYHSKKGALQFQYLKELKTNMFDYSPADDMEIVEENTER